MIGIPSSVYLHLLVVPVVVERAGRRHDSLRPRERGNERGRWVSLLFKGLLEGLKLLGAVCECCGGRLSLVGERPLRRPKAQRRTTTPSLFCSALSSSMSGSLYGGISFKDQQAAAEVARLEEEAAARPAAATTALSLTTPPAPPAPTDDKDAKSKGEFSALDSYPARVC